MKALFWISWLIELVYCLVLIGHLAQQYAQVEHIPLNPAVVRSAWKGIIVGGILVVGGLVLRYGFQSPRLATWFVALPLAGYGVFLLLTVVVAMGRGGFR